MIGTIASVVAGQLTSIISPTLPVESDPLRSDDVLQEAQLLDVRCDTLRSSAALVLELRQALQLREGTTAILVASGIRSLVWTAEPPDTDRTAWSVVASSMREQDVSFELHLGMTPDAELMLSARALSFYIGQVSGLLAAPPSYVESDEAQLRAQLPDWNSAFAVLKQSHTSSRR